MIAKEKREHQPSHDEEEEEKATASQIKWEREEET